MVVSIRGRGSVYTSREELVFVVPGIGSGAVGEEVAVGVIRDRT